MSDAVYDDSKPLSGRRVIITGASRGIGRAIALACAEGGALVSPHLARELVGAFQRLTPPQEDSSTERLTAREREILGLVGRGLSNQEIADELVIAENTVKVHLRNILDKLQVHSRAHAAAIAARAGLTGPITGHQSSSE